MDNKAPLPKVAGPVPNTRNVLKAFHYLKYSTDFDFVKVFLKDFTAFQIFSTDGAVLFARSYSKSSISCMEEEWT